MNDETSDLRLTRRHALALGGAALGGVALGSNVLAQADDGGDGQADGETRSYRVTIANLTQGQPLTPPAVVLHSPEVELFSVGEPANEAVQALAENGNLDPLVSLATGGGGGGEETPTPTPSAGGNATDGTNGNATAGNATDAVDGNATAGNATDGMDGNATAGNATDAVDGNATAGNATDGMDGNATAGNATDGEAAAETPAEDTGGGGVPDAIGGAAVGAVPLVPENDPGATGNPYYTTLEISASANATHLSFVSMLIATNDGFVGLDTVELPEEMNASDTHYANGYDAGTEQNTEQFGDMVPAAQSLILGEATNPSSTASNPDLAESDVIRPHPGIQGDADLTESTFGWDEPAALVVVERIEEAEAPEETETPTEATPDDAGPADNATDAMDGNATTGNATDAMDGNATAGNATDAMDGNATAGNATDAGAGGNTTEGNETG